MRNFYASESGAQVGLSAQQGLKNVIGVDDNVARFWVDILRFSWATDPDVAA